MRLTLQRRSDNCDAKKIMLKIREGKTSCSSVPCKCSLSWCCILVNNNASMREFTRSIPAGARMILSGSSNRAKVYFIHLGSWVPVLWVIQLGVRSSNCTTIFLCFRVNIIVNWVAWKMKRPAGRYLKPGNCIVPPFFYFLIWFWGLIFGLQKQAHYKYSDNWFAWSTCQTSYGTSQDTHDDLYLYAMWVFRCNWILLEQPVLLLVLMSYMIFWSNALLYLLWPLFSMCFSNSCHPEGNHWLWFRRYWEGENKAHGKNVLIFNVLLCLTLPHW
jgi:hypothetical protein